MTVKAKPGASVHHKIRLTDLADGKCAVLVPVRAKAQDGKANAEILGRLAEVLRLDRRLIRCTTKRRLNFF